MYDDVRRPLTLGTTVFVADFSTRGFFVGGSASLFLPSLPMSLRKDVFARACFPSNWKTVAHRSYFDSEAFPSMRRWPRAQRIHVVCRQLSSAARCRRVIAEKNSDVNAVVFTSQQGPSPSEVDASGPLLGWPIAIKDNVCTNSMPTTCSSEMLKGSFRPSHHLRVTNQLGNIAFTAPYDATVVTLLRQSGADIIGKTNCDEFGMGYSLSFPFWASAYESLRSLNIHSVHGPVVNPFKTTPSSLSSYNVERRSAGGSSGGSAAAVASGMCQA